MAELDELVNVLKAAGEVTRLRLLALLASGELSVKDLTDILGQSQPRVSRHLKLLADAGLVERYAEGAWAYYRLAHSGAAAHLVEWLVGNLSEDDPQRRADVLALQEVRKAHQAQASAYFSKVADSWDLLRSLHVPESAVESAILDVVGPGPVETLLDLGTGTGRMLELLAGRYHRGIGVDSNREMIAIARAKLAQAGISVAQVRPGDISALEGTSGPADLIVLHQVLHYFDDPGQILIEARKGLRAGGGVLVVDFAPHDLEFLRQEHAHRRLGMSEAQMGAWASAAGLGVERFESFPNPGDERGLTVCLWMLRDIQTQSHNKDAAE
ncbi:MAG TPA: metalloregulator ArsR/SmtB family transcription factor [Devosiaceae bacterium]